MHVIIKLSCYDTISVRRLYIFYIGGLVVKVELKTKCICLQSGLLIVIVLNVFQCCCMFGVEWVRLDVEMAYLL